MMKSCCFLSALALAVGLTMVEGDAQTAKYPDKPVKILVGFSAGGGTDVVARILAQKMSETLGSNGRGGKSPGRERSHRR